MVCLPCVVIPVCLWIWFQFIMPALLRIKSWFWPAAVKDGEATTAAPVDPAKLECPFDMCKRKAKSEAETTTTSDLETSKNK